MGGVHRAAGARVPHTRRARPRPIHGPAIHIPLILHSYRPRKSLMRLIRMYVSGAAFPPPVWLCPTGNDMALRPPFFKISKQFRIFVRLVALRYM